jgi:hypothetical protein
MEDGIAIHGPAPVLLDRAVGERLAHVADHREHGVSAGALDAAVLVDHEDIGVDQFFQAIEVDRVPVRR